MALNDDINIAHKIIGGSYQKNTSQIFYSHSPIYKFSNENISDLFDMLALEEKRMLTVCGSGDHVLEAILRDVKQVDCFDISIFTKYFMNLKMAALLTLDHKDFIEYFQGDNPSIVFSCEYFDQLASKLKILDNDSYLFWNDLYDFHEGMIIYNSFMFASMYPDYRVHQDKKNYLNKDYYLEMKRKLEKYLAHKKINFFHTDLKDIAKSINESYDVNCLSNIAYYIESVYNQDSEIKFYELIKKEICQFTNENGLILVAYLYGLNNLSNLVNLCLTDRRFLLLPFPSISREMTSASLVYKK